MNRNYKYNNNNKTCNNLIQDIFERVITSENQLTLYIFLNVNNYLIKYHMRIKFGYTKNIYSPIYRYK